MTHSDNSHPNYPTYTANQTDRQRGLRLYLILPIVIHTPLGRVLLGHHLLPAVHLRHRARRRRLLGLLILPGLDEPREPQRDALPTAARGADELVRRGLVPRAERQVRGFHLPDEAGLEPHVRLVLGDGGVSVVGFRLVDDERGELPVEVLEEGVGESRADVADGLVLLGRGVVGGEEEGAVHGGALALAVVGAQDDEVERVAEAGEVVFFDL